MKTRVMSWILAGSALLSGLAHAALDIQAYNPGSKAVFPVTSVLVSGQKEVLLVNAQFDVDNAQVLVDMIKKSGKKLTTIYISSGDPDFYFGLEPLLAAFPGVKVLASAEIVNHIKKTKDAKLAHWGPVLGKSAPKTLVVPDILQEPYLSVEGERIEIKGMQTPKAFLWAASEKTAFGGVSVSSGGHVWMADSQTKAARDEWIQMLDQMLALQPVRVIPGHYSGAEPKGVQAVVDTRDYLKRFEVELAKAKNSAELVDAMKKAYPDLPVTEGLNLGAKVLTGEMKW